MKKQSPLHLLGLLLILAVFGTAMWLLYSQADKYGLTTRAGLMKFWNDDVRKIPASSILLALMVTVVNYSVILVGYDYLAFRYAKVPISLARIAFAALTSYPASYNFGATLAGIPLRFRLYTAWGLPLTKIVQLLVILALTFWFGVFFIAGLLFVLTPLRIPPKELEEIRTTMTQQWQVNENVVNCFADSRLFGVLLLVLTAVYVGASLMHKGSIRFFRWTLPVPPFRLTVYQIAIAAADMLVAASVLFLLLPQLRGPDLLPGAGYLTALEVYLVAYSLVVLSHVPGGWGVLDGVMIALFGTLHLVPNHQENMPKVFAGILVFRVIYYLLPLLFALALVGWHELALRRNWIRPLTPAETGTTEGDGPAGSKARGNAAHSRAAGM